MQMFVVIYRFGISINLSKYQTFGKPLAVPLNQIGVLLKMQHLNAVQIYQKNEF